MKRLFQQVRFFWTNQYSNCCQTRTGESFDSSKCLYVYNIGLHAAYTLAEKGEKDIVVLEAQDRIGGRIHSYRINGNWIELGAQWIHGEGNPLSEFVEDHEVQIFSCILDYTDELILESIHLLLSYCFYSLYMKANFHQTI